MREVTDTVPEHSQAIVTCFKQVGLDTVAELLESTVSAWQSPPTAMQVRLAFAKVGRKAGTLPLALPESAEAQLGLPPPRGGYPADQLARVAIVLDAVPRFVDDEQVALVETLYRTGGEREQGSVLRALALLPGPQRYADLAAEATRTNAVSVFAALACENPFPAAYMPELNFNQMVLKAVFVELDTRRILGLADRVTPKLVRMLEDYAEERRAAERGVPDDVAFVARLWQDKQPAPGA